MRLTRAALRAEATQQVEESETQNASNPHTDLKERVPLGEVSPNSALDSLDIAEIPATKMAPKKNKGKGGAKKGAKGKKGRVAEEDPVEVKDAEVLEDARQAAGSPASDAAVDELAKGPTNDVVQIPMADNRPASPPSRAVRMTRRQLAKHEEEMSMSQRALLVSPPDVALESVDPQVDATVGTQEEEVERGEPVTRDGKLKIQLENAQAPTVSVPEQESISEVEEAINAPESEVTAPEVSVHEPTSPEPKTLTSAQPCESEAATPIHSRAQIRSPSKSPARSPMRLEASIEAIDALEEALENVGKAIPVLDHSGDEKSPRKARFDAVERLRKEAAPRRTALTPGRVSRNPSAPKSLKPSASKSSLTRSTSVRTAASKESQGKRTEVSDYLASKRRPISMTFPAPPPPPRSTKAPTKSTFTLPGEAVAAKLKAQREERLKREAEGGNRPPSATFVAPAPAKASKPPTKPTFQLPGEAIAAKLKAQREERLRREQEEGVKPSFVPPPPPKSTKAPTKANFQLPGEAIAARLKAQREERQRREEEERLKREQEEQIAAAAAAAKRPTFKARPAPARRPISSTSAVRQTTASKARESLILSEKEKENDHAAPVAAPTVSKRSSMLLTRTASSSTTTSTSNRNSIILPSNPGPVVKSTVTPADAAAQRVKGREVFNRDRFEKEAREKERREKEEAAKRARAEAAERGRIASREWAEKQRKKLMGGPA